MVFFFFYVLSFFLTIGLTLTPPFEAPARRKSGRHDEADGWTKATWRHGLLVDHRCCERFLLHLLKVMLYCLIG